MNLKVTVFNQLRKVLMLKPLESLLAQQTCGRGAYSFWGRLAPVHYMYQTSTMRRVYRNGTQYNLNLSDLIDWYIYFGFYEPGFAKLMSLVKKDFNVIDVGSNIGFVLMNIAEKIGNQGKVYGFEPDPVNYDKCRSNLALNHFTNIILERDALGDCEKQVGIAVPDERNRGRNYITDSLKSERSINLVTLDSYVEKNDINKLDLIKVDTEGYELKLLNGAKKAINKLRPIIFIELGEINLNDQGSSIKEVVGLLRAWGYRIYQADSDQEIYSTMEYKGRHFDAYALPE